MQCTAGTTAPMLEVLPATLIVLRGAEHLESWKWLEIVMCFILGYFIKESVFIISELLFLLVSSCPTMCQS